MISSEQQVSMNRAEVHSPATHPRPAGRSAVLAFALAALVAVSVLPGYSSSRRRLFVANAPQITPQVDGFNVTPTLDVGHAVTQVISVGGGEVTAIGADGTKFTLIVPVKALLGAARITMTPITSIGSLPIGGGLAAAVRLEPDGLRLFEFATLVIEPPQSVLPSLETPFAWDQAGSDFHLFPMQLPSRIQRDNARGGQQLNTRGLVFKVLHFSGYGVGSGSDADRAAQQQRQPSGSDARFEQELEGLIGRERKRQLATSLNQTELDSAIHAEAAEEDPDFIDKLIDSLEDQYNNVVKPAMDAALQSKDDAQLQCAILKALGWNRQVALVAPEDLSGKQGKFFKKAQKAVFKFLEKALATMADNSSKRCSKDHKPEEVVTLLGLARQQELLGFGGSETFEKAQQCAHFELEFDSETEIHNPAEVVHTHVHATVPIGLRFINTPGDQIPGQAPINYLSCQWTLIDSPCSATVATQGSVFRVVAFNIDLNPRSIGNCNNGTTDGKLNVVTVDIDPGLPAEIVTAVCPTGTDKLTQLVWVGTFGEFHSDEQDVTGAIVLSDWEPGNGSLLARKTYDRSGFFDGFPMTERTAINLWHRPE